MILIGLNICGMWAGKSRSSKQQRYQELLAKLRDRGIDPEQI